MKLKNYLTTIASAFAGGFYGVLSQVPGTAFLSRDTAQRALAGAAVGGAIAVYHLWQPKPVPVKP